MGISNQFKTIFSNTFVIVLASDIVFPGDLCDGSRYLANSQLGNQNISFYLGTVSPVPCMVWKVQVYGILQETSLFPITYPGST